MKHSSKRSNAKTIGSSSSMCAQLQQMLTLLLMVIALCASRIASSPTHLQQHQQQQQQEQYEQKQHQQQQQQHHQIQQEQQQNHQTTTIRVQQCREGCLEKFASKNPLCQQTSECSTCWEECSKAPPAKISKVIRETWSLHTVSMVQQDSLVLVDVAWEQLSVPYQCLVTWEVSGGGLMGNLLTESFSVQLSLWPETKYRVQVTCKNKLSGLMSRSLPLTIDTSNAIRAVDTEVTTAGRQKAIASFITHMPFSTSLSSIATTMTSTTTTPPATTEGDGEIDTNVVPYDYPQNGVERKGEHTSFVFNWHITAKNNDVTSVEALQKTDDDLLAVLATVHKPLLIGMTAGIVLLMLLLLCFACPLRNSSFPSDKAMLIAEDLTAHRHTLPPPEMIGQSKSTGFTTSTHDNICKSPATCSRHTPRV